MAKKRRNTRRDRGPRGGGSRATRKAARRGAPERRYRQHPMFGEIPLLPSLEHDGLWRYDPDYEPPMPRGAVRGCVSRQDYCPLCHVPRYFYVDEGRDCVQCGKAFTFSAKEQKYWYETLRFHFDSVAIRCARCRRRRRTRAAMNAQISASVQALRDRPDDPTHLLSLAEATVGYRELTGEGDLDAAIAAARRAVRVWAGAVEAIFWEARCHELAGRLAKAREGFSRFLRKAPVTRRTRPLLDRARQFS